MFDRHLKDTASAEPEHFEVLDGWTLPQVGAWQATGGIAASTGPMAANTADRT